VLDLAPLDLGQHRGEGLEISMDVADDGKHTRGAEPDRLPLPDSAREVGRS
jgi:hypothetical protein